MSQELHIVKDARVALLLEKSQIGQFDKSQIAALGVESTDAGGGCVLHFQGHMIVEAGMIVKDEAIILLSPAQLGHLANLVADFAGHGLSRPDYKVFMQALKAKLCGGGCGCPQ